MKIKFRPLTFYLEVEETRAVLDAVFFDTLLLAWLFFASAGFAFDAAGTTTFFEFFT